MTFDIGLRPNVLPWPPMIFVASCLAAYALGRFAPLPFGPLAGTSGRTMEFGGAALALAGAALDLWAMAEMWRGKTNILPHVGADALIASGPFRWTRNPIYCGNVALMCGLAIALGNLWFVAFAIVAALLVERLAIRREEAHLERRFGQAWRDYADRTPRWLF